MVRGNINGVSFFNIFNEKKMNILIYFLCRKEIGMKKRELLSIHEAAATCLAAIKDLGNTCRKYENGTDKIDDQPCQRPSDLYIAVQAIIKRMFALTALTNFQRIR